LPDAQNLVGITVNGTNTVFTVTEAGRYYISFTVNVTVAIAVGARVTINGTPVDELTRAPLLSTSFNGEAIVTLAANDQLTLELFGVLADTVLQDGLGAGLTIIRLDD